jgi:hypothetical protein
MRSRFRTVPLALAAVFALCALGASTASALESLPRLYPAPKEKGIPFTGTSGAVTLVGESILGKTVVSCDGGSSMKGEFVTAKQIANTVITFNGCETKYEGSTVSFGNKGSKETITTEPLSGTLGYLNDTNKSKPEVGLMLGKEWKKGEVNEKLEVVPRPVWAPTMCEYTGSSCFESGPVRGEQLGAITPVNAPTESYTLTVEHTPGEFYQPEYTKFEGGLAGQQLFWAVGLEEKSSKIMFSFTEKLKFTSLRESELEA